MRNVNKTDARGIGFMFHHSHAANPTLAVEPMRTCGGFPLEHGLRFVVRRGEAVLRTERADEAVVKDIRLGPIARVSVADCEKALFDFIDRRVADHLARRATPHPLPMVGRIATKRGDIVGMAGRGAGDRA